MRYLEIWDFWNIHPFGTEKHLLAASIRCCVKLALFLRKEQCFWSIYLSMRSLWFCYYQTIPTFYMYSTFAHIFTYVSRLQNHTQPNITKHSFTRKTLIIFTSHQNRSLYRLELRALHIYSSALRATEVRIRNRNTIIGPPPTKIKCGNERF